MMIIIIIIIIIMNNITKSKCKIVIKVYNTVHVVGFLLGNSTAPEFYMPTFRNTLFHLHGSFEKEE